MSKTNREQFEAWLVSEYYWANDTLNCANFIGDDETGYYIGGDYIYDGGSCGEPLFWAWRGWQASKTKSEAQLTALTSQLESVVAENAALKDAAEFATSPDMWIEQADGMLDYRYCEWYVDVLNAAMETPATAAFLAEVRASGVEMFAEHLSGMNISASETSVREFAAQLRQGGAV